MVGDRCRCHAMRHEPSLILYEHGGTRTPDPQNRNLMLYPLSYMPSNLPYHNSSMIHQQTLWFQELVIKQIKAFVTPSLSCEGFWDATA